MKLSVDKIQALIFLAIPLMYIYNIYVFLLLIVLQMLFSSIGKDDGNKIIITLLITTMYSCISILSLRLYDIVIIFWAIMFLVKKKFKKTYLALIPFLLYVFVLLLYEEHLNDSLIVASRYLFCAIIVLLVINSSNIDFLSLLSDIKTLAIFSAYNAISVFALIKAGKITSWIDGFVNSNIYIYNGSSFQRAAAMDGSEVRLNGFFSDPNKYMVFCLALLILVDVISNNFDVYCNKTITIIMMATIMSLSRVSILILGVYLLIKILCSLYRKRKSAFIFAMLFIIGIFFCFIVNFNMLSNFINELYVGLAKLLGREETLKVNTTLSRDNRLSIWSLAVQYIKESPAWGKGLMACQNLLPYPTHNTLLYLILTGGVIMLVLYILLFMPVFKKIIQYPSVFPCFIIASLVLDLADFRIWYLILGVFIYLSNQCKSSKKSGFLLMEKINGRIQF